MKLTVTGLLLAAMLLLQACAAPSDGPSATPATSFDGLQVAVGSCIKAQSRPTPDVKTKGALDAILTAGISQGVNYLGKALTAAGASKTWTVTGWRNLQPSPNGLPQCIVVVQASFMTTGTPPSWAAPSGWPADLSATLTAKGLLVSRSPDFIFEGEIIPTSDQSALTVRPVIVTYLDPIGTRALRPSEDRSIALFISITIPGGKPTLETNPSAALIFGKMSPNTTRLYDGATTMSSPYESPWFTLSKADSQKALTVHAMLSETQEAQAFLTFLGTVFSDSKVTAAINTEVGQKFVSSASQAADADAASKATTAASDADSKYGIAISKLVACKAATDAAAIAAAADARNALRTYIASDAALAAPRGDVQQPVIDKIDLRRGAGAAKDGCGQVLTELTRI